MKTTESDILRNHNIKPSAQRVAVAQYVFHTTEHPSADEVWHRVQKHFPMVSRATVYNTLKLFVKNGLIQQFILKEGHLVFDSNTEKHHHFIDDETGQIYDVSWSELEVFGVKNLEYFDISGYQVVLHGRKK